MCSKSFKVQDPSTCVQNPSTCSDLDPGPPDVVRLVITWGDETPLSRHALVRVQSLSKDWLQAVHVGKIALSDCQTNILQALCGKQALQALHLNVFRIANPNPQRPSEIESEDEHDTCADTNISIAQEEGQTGWQSLGAQVWVAGAPFGSAVEFLHPSIYRGHVTNHLTCKEHHGRHSVTLLVGAPSSFGLSLHVLVALQPLLPLLLACPSMFLWP